MTDTIKKLPTDRNLTELRLKKLGNFIPCETVRLVAWGDDEGCRFIYDIVECKRAHVIHWFNSMRSDWHAKEIFVDLEAVG